MVWAKVADREIEPPLDLTIGVLRKTDRARLSDALQSRGDIDAVAHQIAVGLLDDIAEMNADAKFDATFGRDARVALDHAILHLDGAADRVDHAAELDDVAVASALDDAAVMRGDGGIDEIATEAPQTREGPILVRPRKPRVADDVGDQDRGQFPGLAHGASAEARSPVAGGMGMAAFPCCTDRRRGGRECRPGIR